MRIGINLLSESGQSAGVRTYVTQLMGSLADMDSRNQYYVFVSRDNFDSFYVRKANFKYVSLKFPTASAILRRALEQLVVPFISWRASVDLIHSINNVGILFTRLPLVVTIHDMAPVRLKNRFGTTKSLYLKSLVPISARKAKRVLAVSEAAKTEIMELCGIDGEKVVVTYNGVSERFSLDPREEESQIREKLGIGQNYILYVGTLEPGKNVSRVIEAFARSLRKLKERYSLVIAGRAGWLYGEIFESVKRLGLDKEVIFTGYVSQEDLPVLYGGAVVFVFPSLYEGFGLPVLEAMACGTPVITSNISSLPEVAGDAAVLVDPYDVGEIAEAIVRVVSDEGLREELSRRGRHRARQFSWERCASETLKVYEEVYRETKRCMS